MIGEKIRYERFFKWACYVDVVLSVEFRGIVDEMVLLLHRLVKNKCFLGTNHCFIVRRVHCLVLTCIPMCVSNIFSVD